MIEVKKKRTAKELIALTALAAIFSLTVSFVFVGLTNSDPVDAVREFWGTSAITFMICLFSSGILKGE